MTLGAAQPDFCLFIIVCIPPFSPEVGAQSGKNFGYGGFNTRVELEGQSPEKTKTLGKAEGSKGRGRANGSWADSLNVSNT